MRNKILRSANAKYHYPYLFFYKINKGDLPLNTPNNTGSCVVWCESIIIMHQSIPAAPSPPSPRATAGYLPALSVPGVGHLQILCCPGAGHSPTPGHSLAFVTHAVSYQNTLFFLYKNIFYKNIEAEICEILRIF